MFHCKHRRTVHALCSDQNNTESLQWLSTVHTQCWHRCCGKPLKKWSWDIINFRWPPNPVRTFWLFYGFSVLPSVILCQPPLLNLHYISASTKGSPRSPPANACPPSTLAELFWWTCLQSRLSQFSKKFSNLSAKIICH